MIIYIILYADMQKNNMDTFYEYEIIIICRKYIKYMCMIYTCMIHSCTTTKYSSLCQDWCGAGSRIF